MLFVICARIIRKSADTHFGELAPVVQNAIHRINLYPVDNAVGFPTTYPLAGDLSGG